MSEANSITLLIEKVNITELLNSNISLLEQLDAQRFAALSDFLLDNIENKDGSPSISNLSIENLTFNESTNRGKFRLKFQIDRRFCCSGTEACANDYIDFDFVYNDPNIEAKASYFNWELNN